MKLQQNPAQKLWSSVTFHNNWDKYKSSFSGVNTDSGTDFKLLHDEVKKKKNPEA